MDTPGIIPYQEGRKLKAPKSFLTGPQRSLMNAELGGQHCCVCVCYKLTDTFAGSNSGSGCHGQTIKTSTGSISPANPLTPP